MTSMKDIMREPTRAKRNFLQENKGYVKKIDEQNREKKNCFPEIPPRNQKYANVKAKVTTAYGRGESKNNKACNKFEQPPNLYPAWYAESPKSHKSVTTCDEAIQCNEHSILALNSHKHKSTQTLENLDEEGYGSGKVMAPSVRAWTSLDSLHLRVPSDCNEEARPKSQFTQRSHSPAGELAEHHATLADQMMWPNKAPKATMRRPENPLKAPPTYQKGVVPRYLRERNEEQQREAERVLRTAPDPACPPGHRKLSEQERLDSLAELNATQEKLLVQLNRLPVRLHTLRAQNQRQHLDTELDKVEKLILAFSKPKVFVEEHP